MTKKKKTLKHFPFGLCMVSAAPVRLKPDHRSEMISQVLFGEQVVVYKSKNKRWLYISCVWDECYGWVDPKQFIRLSENDAVKYNRDVYKTLEIQQAVVSDNRVQSVLLGSSLPSYDGISFAFPFNKYIYSGQAIDPKRTLIRKDIFFKMIKKYLYAPFLWGGRSPFGIDCSGYTQVVYSMCNVLLPRNVIAQVEKGEVVDFVESAKLGDMAFFENREGDIDHVGIVLDDMMIIHVSGQVRIDTLDHYGIYNKEIKKYSHKLRIIKRVLQINDNTKTIVSNHTE